MSSFPPFQAGGTAVITGAADGIGLAAALRFADLGLNIVLADRDAEKLKQAGETVSAAAKGGRVVAQPTDVADADQIARLRDTAFEQFGGVSVLMNNAGMGGVGHAFQNPDGWARLLSVNLFGVINGVQAFTQAMIDQNSPAVIVNTGSKQGITTPPGDTAYNVSKAGVKALTEGLQHTLRETPGCQVSAHLLVPGFTFTGMIRQHIAEKPASAWTSEQLIDYALERIAAGDFYIICPDNEVTRAVDNARILWAAQDITENRPPLSRWHPDWQDAFADYMAKIESD